MGELATAPDLIANIIASACSECLTTGIAIENKALRRCSRCEEAQFTEAAVRLSVRLWWMKDQGKPVDLKAVKLARLLTLATFTLPFSGKLLRRHFGLTPRSLKDLVEHLRADWVLPIGAHRQPPYGYYWIASPEEFKHWMRTMRSQAMRELSTAYRLYRNVYPELAGQEALDFASDFSNDLKEAIK